MGKTVSIYGAGLAGLVAGIHLARSGFKAVVYDREDGIGGSKQIHPSIHTTPLQPVQTWDYIGMDLSSCFRKTDKYPDFWYNTKRLVLPPYVKNNAAWNVERGAQEGSLDRKLYEIALGEDVEFVFNRNLTLDELRAAPAGSIIATGLYREIYDLVGVKCGPTYGYMASAPCRPGESTGALYMGNYSVDYGYSASMNGLMYVLLFSRTPLKKHKIEEFKEVLKKTERLDFDNWHSFNGFFPRETKLHWDDKILAGTLSGMIEPFWGYGVVGALLSGKVAGLLHTDPERAERDFRKFTAGFKAKLARKEKLDRLPFSKMLLRLSILKARYDCWRNPALKNAVREPVRWF
jgi:hypothetical protein